MERRDAEGTGASHRRSMVAAGHRGDRVTIAGGRRDPDPAARAARLGALARVGSLSVAEVAEGLADREPAVRRRAAALAARVGGPGSRARLPSLLVGRLADDDPLVVEAAAWALGERRARSGVGALAHCALTHVDPRCREAAVAALGSIGDPAGLPAVLASLEDRPPVRRRAVVALAAFEGEEVEAALERCRSDRDWQVRQAAEILLGR